MAADTSSSAAASTPVVWVTAARFAAVSAEPISAKSFAAEVIISGAAATNDISGLPTGHDNLTGVRLSSRCPRRPYILTSFTCEFRRLNQTSSSRLGPDATYRSGRRAARATSKRDDGGKPFGPGAISHLNVDRASRRRARIGAARSTSQTPTTPIWFAA